MGREQPLLRGLVVMERKPKERKAVTDPKALAIAELLRTGNHSKEVAARVRDLLGALPRPLFITYRRGIEPMTRVYIGNGCKTFGSPIAWAIQEARGQHLLAEERDRAKESLEKRMVEQREWEKRQLLAENEYGRPAP